MKLCWQDLEQTSPYHWWLSHSLTLVICHSYITVPSWEMQTTFEWRWFLQNPPHSCLCPGYDWDVQNRSRILLCLKGPICVCKLSSRPSSEIGLGQPCVRSWPHSCFSCWDRFISDIHNYCPYVDGLYWWNIGPLPKTRGSISCQPWRIHS